MEITIRRETGADYRAVEEITREAFWNHHVPGCDEHYLAHVMRDHEDFIPELDFVALADGTLVGNIMFTRSWVENEAGTVLETLTFGPVSVLPEYQKRGIGSALIRHAVQSAKDLGWNAIIIYGHPHNYCRHGFKGSKDYGVSTQDGTFPYSLLVLELEPGVFSGRTWKYRESAVYDIDLDASKQFDATFPPKEKGWRPSQEEFRIASRAFVE